VVSLLATADTLIRASSSSFFSRCQHRVRSGVRWVRAAGAALLARAQHAGTVRADLAMGTLLMLVTGIAMTAEHSPDNAMSLLPWLIDGVRPR
jgi:hypothetical protein